MFNKSGRLTEIVWIVDCSNVFILIYFLKRVDVIVVVLTLGRTGVETFGTIPIFTYPIGVTEPVC